MGDAKVLILGGCGFVGRNMVKFLVDNNLCSLIVVADKCLPQTSYFAEEHVEAFANKELVQFKQADLTKDPHVQRVFELATYDFVVNLCGETRFGLTDNDYKTKIEEACRKCSGAAKAQEPSPKWIEVSTAQVYKADKKPSTESSILKPWTKLATSRYAAEGIVAASGLEYVVLRPVIVYGKGDLTGMTPRLVIGATYAYLKEKLRFLWGDSLGVGTVHVIDVCGAIWTSCKELPSGSIFNLADESMLTQGKLNKMLAEMFGIQASTVGDIKSKLAQTAHGLVAVAEEANDKHVPAWTMLCTEQKVSNTPLSPYIDKELLYNNSLSVDGSAITKASSFKYTQPQVTLQTLSEQVAAFEQQGTWPGKS